MTTKTSMGAAGLAALAQAGDTQAARPQVRHRFEQVGDVKVFYREAGAPDAPTVLLLHGYAASSFMYRNLIPMLADKYHVIAPDLPGFGFTEAPARGEYAYTFDQLARTIDQFTQQLGLDRYAIQVFDYGAPVGWRLAAAHPDRITAIISQNGNAYEEGLGQGWAPIQRYWKEPSQANREALRDFPTPASIEWQYLEGVPDKTLVAPDAIALESYLVSRPGNAEVQLDLLLDYASNVAKYPAFQAYFREHQPPLLAVWGRNDPFFLPAGAEAWKRDIPGADVRFYDTGHLALETHGAEIGGVIREFLDRNLAYDLRLAKKTIKYGGHQNEN
jgi:pimeloyl-ACP methyl ester carboxylesterase